MTEENTFNPLIRVDDQEAHRKLRILCQQDRRFMGKEIAHLIEAEYARRFSAPSLITIAEAEAAAAKVEA